jgi:hypothetical protein
MIVGAMTGLPYPGVSWFLEMALQPIVSFGDCRIWLCEVMFALKPYRLNPQISAASAAYGI